MPEPTDAQRERAHDLARWLYSYFESGETCLEPLVTLENYLAQALADEAARVGSVLDDLERRLERMVDLKREVYQAEPVSHYAADVAARHLGRMATEALAALEAHRGTR
jgi:hypothetical protein